MWRLTFPHFRADCKDAFNFFECFSNSNNTNWSISITNTLHYTICICCNLTPNQSWQIWMVLVVGGLWVTCWDVHGKCLFGNVFVCFRDKHSTTLCKRGGGGIVFKAWVERVSLPPTCLKRMLMVMGWMHGSMSIRINGRRLSKHCTMHC